MYDFLLFFFSDEQGQYFRQISSEALHDWRARQKGLPSPQTDDEKPREENSPQSVHAPASATSDTMGSFGPGWLKLLLVPCFIPLKFRRKSEITPAHLRFSKLDSWFETANILNLHQRGRHVVSAKLTQWPAWIVLAASKKYTSVFHSSRYWNGRDNSPFC